MKTFALLGYYGVGNLGDEAVVSTLIRNIRERQPGARIVGISLDPRDTRARHGIDSFPLRRRAVPRVPVPRSRVLSAALALLAGLFLKLPAEAWHMLASFRTLRTIDAVIVAGSGGVYDWWHGAWTHPFTHFRWAVLCRLSRTRLVYLSVGAGPFTTRLGKFFFRWALSSASYCSVRDEASLEWMSMIGVSKPVALFPDMAFDITACSSRGIRRTLPAGLAPRRIGINALPFYHDQWSALMNREGIGYPAYIETMAEFISWLLDRNCEIVFFHSQIGDGFLDRDIAGAVDARRGEHSWRRKARFADIRTPDELVDELAALDLVVASRFHSVLFSYLIRKPVLGISYHHKVEDLMQRMNQSAYTLDIRTLSFEMLGAAFRALEHELETGRWSLPEETFMQYRQRLSAQFDDVFSDPIHN